MKISEMVSLMASAIETMAVRLVALEKQTADAELIRRLTRQLAKAEERIGALEIRTNKENRELKTRMSTLVELRIAREQNR